MAEAQWIDGVSTLPQARPTQTAEWVWCDGYSAPVPVDNYETTGYVPYPFSRGARGGNNAQSGGLQ